MPLRLQETVAAPTKKKVEEALKAARLSASHVTETWWSSAPTSLVEESARFALSVLGNARAPSVSLFHGKLKFVSESSTSFFTPLPLCMSGPLSLSVNDRSPQVKSLESEDHEEVKWKHNCTSHVERLHGEVKWSDDRKESLLFAKTYLNLMEEEEDGHGSSNGARLRYVTTADSWGLMLCWFPDDPILEWRPYCDVSMKAG